MMPRDETSQYENVNERHNMITLTMSCVRVVFPRNTFRSWQYLQHSGGREK